MTFTVYASSSVVVAPPHVSVPTADPWDAPYFGGRVYFSYHPTLSATPPAAQTPLATSAAIATAAPMTPTASEPAQAQALPHRPAALGFDPWDAPYFGGPVYFRYPAFSVAVAAFASPVAPMDETPDAPDAPSAPPTPAPDSPVAFVPPAAMESPGPPAATPASTPHRRGWLARLFRAG